MMDTTTINTLITAGSGALVGLVGMWIHGNQLGKRIDDLRIDTKHGIDAVRTDLNHAIDTLRADMNRQFDKVDARFEKINGDLKEWNKIQTEQDGRISDLERKKP
jgi:hypothetical protein